MKQSIAYEWKRILLPMCIFTVIATAFFVIMALSAEFVFERNLFSPDGTQSEMMPKNTLVYVPATVLGVLCYLVPAIQFSYRMKRRSVDLWYSLPVRREKLMLVRIIFGLLLIFIPYTICYFSGLTIIACRFNLFEMQYYAILYFASLPLGILLFGVNSFLYTRANTLFDGIVFMIGGAFLILAPVNFALTWLERGSSLHISYALKNNLHYMTFGPLAELYMVFDSAILGDGLSMGMAWIPYTIVAVEGAAAYFGLLYTAGAHRAESAEQVSDSPFGYSVQIPFYLFWITASTRPDSSLFSGNLLFVKFLLIVVVAAAAYFVYRRSFRLKKIDCINLAAYFVAGLGVMAIMWLMT